MGVLVLKVLKVSWVFLACLASKGSLVSLATPALADPSVLRARVDSEVHLVTTGMKVCMDLLVFPAKLDPSALKVTKEDLDPVANPVPTASMALPAKLELKAPRALLVLRERPATLEFVVLPAFPAKPA